MALIELQGVTKEYDLGHVKVSALRGVDLTINQGDFVVIAGPSGSGKTTLLNIIGMLDNLSNGSYRLDGELIAQQDFDALAERRNKMIGFVFQNFNLIPVLTARENIEFPLRIMGPVSAADRQYIEQLIEEVGLKPFASHRPLELSGGQQQRVAIARALSTRPKLVIADEPTANLDTETAMTIIEVMQRMNAERSVTFIFSTHDQRLIDHAQRIVKLQDGVVLEISGNPC